jgi:uncharacterized protein YegL
MRFEDKNKKDMLKSFMASNQARKLDLLKRTGFADRLIFEAWLINGIEVENPMLAEKATNINPLKIYNVHILDNSGSMEGEKFNSAFEGIQLEVEDLKKNKEVQFYQMLAHFDNCSPHIATYPIKIDKFTMPQYIGTYNDTPLYATIKKVLIYLLEQKVHMQGKVLVKIFTDGKENPDSRHRINAREISKLIQKCEDLEYTITFVGTYHDVEHVKKQLSIDASNTLVHENTSDSIRESFNTTKEATRIYTSSVQAGEDVTKGFYSKKIGKL